MSTTTNTPTPSALPQELIMAAGAAGSLAQTILDADGKQSAAAIVPVAVSLVSTAIAALTAAQGQPVTVAQLQALLGQDVPLVAPE